MQIEEAHAVIANQIVIKLGGISFFNEFGNVLGIVNWTKVRKKTSSGSALAFFSKGRSIAHFSSLGISLIASDKLIILVSIGT